MAKNASQRVIPFYLITALLLSADQVSKAWALTALEAFQGKPFIGEVLKFYLVWNDSAAFSIGFGITWIFTIISSVASIVIVWLLSKSRVTSWRITLAILLAGVLGNLADRLFRAPGFPVGHVVDFLQLPFGFPVFNVADICITGSMTMVVILIMRGVKLRS
jgi:signal peptidase II